MVRNLKFESIYPQVHTLIVPIWLLTPPPVAIRHLLLRNRYRPDGLHGVQSKARPNRNVPAE